MGKYITVSFDSERFVEDLLQNTESTDTVDEQVIWYALNNEFMGGMAGATCASIAQLDIVASLVWENLQDVIIEELRKRESF